MHTTPEFALTRDDHRRLQKVDQVDRCLARIPRA